MTSPLTDADLAAMEARADARVRWCEWAPTRLAPPSEFCGAACVVRCDGCAVTRCAAHAEECDGGCDHAWTTLDESAADLRAALAELRRLRSLCAAARASGIADAADAVDVAAAAREEIADGWRRNGETEGDVEEALSEAGRLRELAAFIRGLPVTT